MTTQLASVNPFVFVQGLAEIEHLADFIMCDDADAHIIAPGDQPNLRGEPVPRSKTGARWVPPANAPTITGALPAGVTYYPSRGVLAYNGTGAPSTSTVTLDLGAQSRTFDVRVLTPTIVYGHNAAAVNTQFGWGATVIDPSSGGTWQQVRQAYTNGGDSVIFVTTPNPGSFYDDNWYCGGPDRFYMLGDLRSVPRFGDQSIGTESFRFDKPADTRVIYRKNIEQDNVWGCRLGGNVAEGVDMEWTERNIHIHDIVNLGEDGYGTSGSGSITTGSPPYPAVEGKPGFRFWASGVKIDGPGGNSLKQSLYMQAGPYSWASASRVDIRGGRQNTGLRFIMGFGQVANSFFQTLRDDHMITYDPDFDINTAMVKGVEFSGAQQSVEYNNHIRQVVKNGGSGMTECTFLRARRSLAGGPYPLIPRAAYRSDEADSNVTELGYGDGWPVPVGVINEGAGTTATYWDGAGYWTDVANADPADLASSYFFDHWVYRCTFELVFGDLTTGSRTAYRADASMPVVSFETGEFPREILSHPNWNDRVRVITAANTYLGDYSAGQIRQTDFKQYQLVGDPGSLAEFYTEDEYSALSQAERDALGTNYAIGLGNGGPAGATNADGSWPYYSYTPTRDEPTVIYLGGDIGPHAEADGGAPVTLPATFRLCIESDPLAA